MKVSKTGKALCAMCRRLATGEGNVHRHHGRLAVMVYCGEHAEYVGDCKPLGYYRQFFTHIDDMCERENVNQLQYCKHPMTGESTLPFVQVACSLLHEHDWSLDNVRAWLHSIAGQPGCVKFTARMLSAAERRQRETAVPEGCYQKSDRHLPEPLPAYSCVETTTATPVPDVHELLALVLDYYAAALLGEKLTDPSYEEEREFQARMIGLIDRTEKLLDLDTGEREAADEREWVTSLAEQRANASMWGY